MRVRLGCAKHPSMQLGLVARIAPVCTLRNTSGVLLKKPNQCRRCLPRPLVRQRATSPPADTPGLVRAFVNQRQLPLALLPAAQQAHAIRPR